MILHRFDRLMDRLKAADPAIATRVYQGVVHNLGYANPHPLAFQVRQAAVNVCAKVGRRILPYLLEIENPSPWQFRANIILASVSVAPDDQHVQQLIRKASEDTRPEIRRHALLGLSRITASWAQPLFENLLVDPNPLIREVAAQLQYQRNPVNMDKPLFSKKKKPAAKAPVLSPLEKLIQDHYSAEQLNRIYQTYIKNFTDEVDVLKKIEEGQKRIKKVILVQALGAILDNKKRFLKLVSMLPGATRALLNMLVWDAREVDSKNIPDNIDSDVVEIKQGRYHQFDAQLQDDFFLFGLRTEYDYRWNPSNPRRVYIRLNEDFRDRFRKYLPPPSEYDLTGHKTVQGGTILFEDRDWIIQQLPVLIGYVSEGHLKLSKSGNKILVRSIKDMTGACNIKEFYTPTEKDLQHLRTRLTAEFLLEGVLKKQKVTHAYLKSLFRGFLDGTNFRSYELKDLLFHLKGPLYNHWHYREQEMSVRSTFNAVGQRLPEGQWISIEHIRKHCHYRNIPLDILDLRFTEGSLYFEGEDTRPGNPKKTKIYNRKMYDRIYMTDSLYPDAVTNPLIKGVMFLFASFGLVDILYDLPKTPQLKQKGKPYLSIFDGLTHVRLTALGAYVFDQRTSFKTQFEEVCADIRLDDQRLMIYLSEEDRLKALMLSKIGEQVTDTCFRVTFGSFMKDCDSIAKIQGKIQFFKEKICPKPSGVWKEFINEVESKLNPLAVVQAQTVYKLNPSRELISLIATDAVLKKYIRKAEDYHIVVENQHIGKVKKRLQSFGFFVEQW